MQESTSDLLRDNCDEFIYYEDLGKTPTHGAAASTRSCRRPSARCSPCCMESLLALRRENKEVLWSSMIKDTMKRKKPSFNESYHGYRTFSELLEDAAKQGLLELDTDKRSRTYVVTRFGSEMHAPTAPAGNKLAAAEGESAAKKKSSRRRRTGKKRPQAPTPASAAPAADPMSLAANGAENELAPFEEQGAEAQGDDFDSEPIPDEEVLFTRGDEPESKAESSGMPGSKNDRGTHEDDEMIPF